MLTSKALSQALWQVERWGLADVQELGEEAVLQDCSGVLAPGPRRAPCPSTLVFLPCCPGLAMTLGFQSTALNYKVDSFSQISWIGRVCKNGSYWIFLGFLFFSPSEPWYLALSFSGFFPQCFAHCYLPHAHPTFLSHSSFCLGNASPSLKILFKHLWGLTWPPLTVSH